MEEVLDWVELADLKPAEVFLTRIFEQAWRPNLTWDIRAVGGSYRSSGLLVFFYLLMIEECCWCLG